MSKRIKQFMLFATLGVILSIAFAGTAQAEQCQQFTTNPLDVNKESKQISICLVTDTSQSLVAPAPLLFKVSSEATRFTGRLVQSGPENNLWEADVSTAADGVVPYGVTASVPWSGPCDPYSGSGCGSDDYKATFSIPVQAPIANQDVVIKRTKKQVVAIYRYEGRTAVTATVRLYLNSFKGETSILARRNYSAVTGVGPQVLKVVLPRKVIDRKCGKGKKFLRCSVLAEGQSSIGQYKVDQGTYDRKRVK